MRGRGLVMATLSGDDGDTCSTNAIKRQRLSTELDNHSAKVSMSGVPRVNPFLSDLEKDFLYHIGYDSHQCKEAFKDVKVFRNSRERGLVALASPSTFCRHNIILQCTWES